MNTRRILLKALPWLVLWCAFAAFGVWVRTVQPWWTDGRPGSIEINALDYRRYSQMLEHWNMIFYAAFRHPLYGWLMAPVIGIGARFRELGEWPFWGWLIAFFSAVMTSAHFLVYWLLRRLSLERLEAAACTALFASFAASWILAACPESFNISCVLALVTLHFALYVRRHAETMDRRLEYAGWVGLAVATGGITSTQVVKTALAYFVTRRPSWRRILQVASGILVAGVLVVLVFLVRVYLRTAPGCFVEELGVSLNNITTSFVGGGMSFPARLGRVFVFFTEPIVTRGIPFEEKVLPTHYGSSVSAVLAMLPLVAAAVSVWAARRDFVVRLIATMALVDIGIHFILFWGMVEAQIYAGHWYYAVPVLVGVGLLRLKGRARRWAGVAIAVLAAAILWQNLSVRPGF